MRICHNLLSINTNNTLVVSAKKREKLMGQLSSGYRINSAADDAAGLTISEKMRSQIRGLNQASKNAQDGMSLIQTAEGSLGEVHDILQRIHELSVQAANDIYNESDRNANQKEINELVKEIDGLSNKTEFNGIKLLDGSMAETVTMDSPLISVNENKMTLKELLNNDSKNLNIIYMNETDSFDTTKTGAGTATISGSGNLKNILQTEIVPQAVTSVLRAFSPAFNYLSSSSIGIGLKLYSDPATTTLAAVNIGFSVIGGVNVDATMLTYQLSVNMASLAYDGTGNLTSESRSALETTIVHEMVHGFMDETLTNGMIGINHGVFDARDTGAQANYQKSANSYPNWFKEGMAQTAAGGYANSNDWVNSGLGIITSTSQAAITSIVKNGSYSLTSGTTASKYGTGYLASMYLGYLASGSSNVTAADISVGLGKVLSDLGGGKSLDAAINERTGGRYTSVSDLENKFGDGDSSSFIYNLTQMVGSTGNGGLATGNLADNDLLANTPVTTSLFSLDTTNDIVKNIYPSNVNVLSGGGKSNSGTAPVGDYTSTITGGGTVPIINPGSTIDLSNLSAIAGINYDSALNVLTITNSGDYTLTGLNTTGVRVVVNSGVNANITLNNTKIDTATGAGISLEGNANVTLKLVGSNSVLTSKMGAAAIRVTTGGTLTIQGNGTLDAESIYHGVNNGAGIGGGYGEDGGNIIIDGGTITAKATGEGADIGGGENGNGGTITINGGSVTVESLWDDPITYPSGAGIGGGSGGNGGSITITGGSVNTTSDRSGAGIGGGTAGSGGNITITGGTIVAGNAIGGAGIGGGFHGGDGGIIKISGGTITAKGGDSAAGIGGGDFGAGGNITITGGTITAQGGSHVLNNGTCVGGAGIGGGIGKAGGSININGSGVIIKTIGGGDAANIGGGAPNTGFGGTPVSGGTVAKTTGIIFEGAGGAVYGNVTLGGPVDCDGKPLNVLGGSILTVLNGGQIRNHGNFTNSGRIENHGAIGSVSGTGTTHHYATAISKNIKEPSTAIIGESLAQSISKLSPSTITVAYNGTTKTLAGQWVVSDTNGQSITDLSRTIVGANDSYKYTVFFISEDDIYFDPLHMSMYAMKGYNADDSKYEIVSDEYVSKTGPEGGGSALTYSYIVSSSLGESVSEPTSQQIGGIKLQIGANANQTLTVTIESIKSRDLGIDSLSVLTHEDAEKAITASYEAINKVSQIRSNLGAVQNRLGHAIANMNNMEERLQDAESRIRDMDMAEGMVEYSKHQILMQMGQAMLAQANQSPKSVLALLS